MAVMSIRRPVMHNVPRLRPTATDAGLNAITGRGERAQTFEPGAVRYIKLGENRYRAGNNSLRLSLGRSSSLPGRR